MAKKLAPITVPSIPIEPQPVWDDLSSKYISKYVVVSGGFVLTEAYFYLAHTHNNSTLLHSVASHLYSERGNYKFDHSYRLLKSVVLEGFFSLRESLCGFVNVIYGLGENTHKQGSSYRILKESRSLCPVVAKQLDEIVPKASNLGRYLEKYRHPYVHREDLSGITIPDMTAAMIGTEQPRMTEFITESYKTSRWLQGIESSIVKECAVKLKLT
jgi:hypothetical protein